MERFEKGDIAYTNSGSQVEFIAEIDGEAVVRKILTRDDDDEPAYGTPFAVRDLYKTPPVEKCHAKITELKDKIVELTSKRDGLQREILSLMNDDKERKQRISQHAALRQIDDFLAGKIKYFVYYEYRIKMLSFDDAMKYKVSDYDRVPSGIRLLCLYGKTNGDVSWGISRYSDGSGSIEWVIPCTSRAHAIAVATEKINIEYGRWRANKKQDGPAWNGAEAAKELGIPIPGDVAAMIKEKRVKNLTERVAKARQDFETVQAELAAEEGGDAHAATEKL